MKKSFAILPFLYKWHRRTGLFLAIVFLPIALTGVLLNHTDALGLSKTHINFKPLLAWYGIDTQLNITHFKTTAQPISLVNNRIFISGQPTELSLSTLKGAIYTGSSYALLGEAEILLMTEVGEQIERILPLHGLPQGGGLIGLSEKGIWLQTNEALYLSPDLMSWEQHKAIVAWSRPTPPSSELQKLIQLRYRGNGLPLERIILDMHSGRIFSGLTVFLTDLAAFGIFYLVFTGLFMWRKMHFKKPLKS